VRTATKGDLGALAAVLASAFADDPPTIWILPSDKDRTKRLARLFRTTLRTDALRNTGAVDVAVSGGQVVGGAVWYPPKCWPPSAGRQLRGLPGYAWALGRRFGAATALVGKMGKAHPGEPHWYLAYFGVEPSSQGQGIGSALMSSRLARIDALVVPAYLESSKVSNVTLYEHFGFRSPRVGRSYPRCGGSRGLLAHRRVSGRGRTFDRCCQRGRIVSSRHPIAKPLEEPRPSGCIMSLA
jgi:GNAT superfamily N-acetyltransferase